MLKATSWAQIARRQGARPPDGGSPAYVMHDSGSTLIFSWFCTGASIVLIALRLVGRWMRSRTLFPEDKVMLASVVPLLARMALVHVILIWGTNNVNLSRSLSAEEIHHRSIGSRLVLASRIFYAMFIWMAKFTISEFLKRLTASYWRSSYQLVLHGIRIFLLVSFIGVVIAILAECHPFDHYWQVVPDPGPHCRQAHAQLWTMAVADIITDILLVVFPLSIILPATGIPILRRLRISFLFGLSAVNMVITVWRVASVVHSHGSQQRRTIFASSEILAAAVVANAVILSSFVRDRGLKRPTWQSDMNATQADAANGAPGGTMLSSKARSILTPSSSQIAPVSATEPLHRQLSRRPTLMTRLTEAGASDEELFAGMCYRPAKSEFDMDDGLDPLHEEITPIARPAQSISREQMSRHLSIAIPLDDADMGPDDFPPTSACDPDVAQVLGSHRDGGDKTVTLSDPGGLLGRASTRDDSPAAGREVEPLQLGVHAEETMLAGRRWTPNAGDTSKYADTGAQLQDAGGLLDSQAQVAIQSDGSGRQRMVDTTPGHAEEKDLP